MPDERIARLSQRFKTHSLGRRPTATRSRERHSFYLDGALVEQVASTYREVNHALHNTALTGMHYDVTHLTYHAKILHRVILRVLIHVMSNLVLLSSMPTILAGVFVPLENVVSRELYFLFRQSIEKQKHDHARHPDLP